MNGVRSRFIPRLPASSVLRYLGICQIGEGDRSTGEIYQAAMVAQKAQTGEDDVLAAGKQAQHATGVPVVSGLTEYFVSETDQRIRAKHNVAVLPSDRASLLLSQSADEMGRRLAGRPDFGNRSGPDNMVDAGKSQQLMTARRGRGKNEHSITTIAEERTRGASSALAT